MGKGVQSTFLVVALCFLCRVSLCIPQLELATVVYRHGDRTPIRTWPTDPYADASYWPQGYGQLTARGMSQQYFLGEVLYDRYINGTYSGFINENYTRTQLYIRSTDVDRTLMSAEVQLSALFYLNNASQRFNPDLPWQPVPVHTVPLGDDNLLRAFEMDCPYYTQLVDASYVTPEYIQLEQQNSDLVQFLRSATSVSTLQLEDLWFIEDTLFIENIYDRTPSWYNSSLFDRIKNISDYTLSLMYDTKEKNRLSAGVFVGELVDHMNDTVMGNSNGMKMYMYSAHDTTVAAVMSALGVYNKIQPPYAAAFMIELFSDNGTFFVKCFYRNDTATANIQELYIPSCGGTRCTWAQFVNYTKDLIPADWNAECQLPTPKPTTTSSPSTTSSPTTTSSPSQLASSEVAAITLGAILGLVILLIAICMVLVFRSKRSQSKRLRIDDTETPLITAKNSF